MRKRFSVSRDTAIFLFVLAALLGAGYGQRSRASAKVATPSEPEVTSSATPAPTPAVSSDWRVRDDAGFLDPDVASGLAGYLRGINTESGVDIRFIFASNPPAELETYAVAQAREIGIGRDMDRRSMLFVYDVARQRMRVEVGPRMQGMFPDGLLGYLMREQTAALFASGNKKQALKSTLNIVSYRLREAALDGSYDPRAVAYITNSTRLANGGGATARIPRGSERTVPVMTGDELRARFAPQPTVAHAFARYLEALRDGHYEPDLPLYTPGTQMVFRALQIQRPFAEFILYAEYGHKYSIVERGDVAILYFTNTPFVSAHLFRRTPAGWQLDIEAEIHDTREFVGSPYTWGMMPTGDEYWRAFSDLMADFGPTGVGPRDGRPAPSRFLRPAKGDNRPLPTRKGREPAPARPIPLHSGSLLLPNVGTDSESLGYPTQTIDRLAVRRLLREKAFDSLDVILSAYGDSAVRDYRLEYRLFDGYAAFEAAIPALEPLLNEWVQRKPGSAPALLARGSFYYAMGGDARGAAFANKTSLSQFRGMSSYYRKASADFNTALRTAPRSFVAYRALMYIAAHESETETCRELLDRGLKIQPYSFRLRAVYMENLLPRWGGSYEEMKRFNAESAPYAARNPRIRALGGYIDWDRGRILEKQGENAAAIEAYGRALSYGDFYIFRLERGELYWIQDRNAEAIEDLNKGLLQKPQDADALYERSRAAYDLGFDAKGEARSRYFGQAYDDIVQSVALDPGNLPLQRHLAFIKENIPEYEPPPHPR